jgi:hypothetical protein
MGYLHDNVLDSGLSYLKSNASHIYICNAEPSTYTQASSTYALGSKNFGAGAVVPGALAAGSPSGRKATTAAITDGSVSGTGTASHWAITFNSSSILLAASSLSASQAVTNGNTFTLGAFDIRLPGTGG